MFDHDRDGYINIKELKRVRNVNLFNFPDPDFHDAWFLAGPEGYRGVHG